MDHRAPRGALAAAWAAAFAAGLGGAAPADARSPWASEEDRCMAAFRRGDGAALDELVGCMRLWEAYRSGADLEDLGSDERDAAEWGFRSVCARGGAREAYAAEAALARLGRPPTAPCRGVEPARSGPAAASGVAPERGAVEAAGPSKYDPPSVDEGAQRRAQDAARQGTQLARAGKHAEALHQYERAIAIDPRYEVALFNAACMQCRLGDVGGAHGRLANLYDLGTQGSRDLLQGGRTEPDLAACRDHEAFRRVTGYARIQLVNSVGPFGEPEIERMVDYLERAGHAVANIGETGQERAEPTIYYREGAAKNTAWVVEKLVNHPECILAPLEGPSDYDIVVIWGDTFAENPETGEPEPVSHEAKDPDTLARDARSEQDRALAQPDKVANDVDNYARTPERMKDAGERSIKRTKQSVDKVKRVGKTVESFGGLKK